MELPKQLKYSQLQAKAFFSYFKQWPLQPIQNGGQYFPGQVIRVFFNALTDGVMDPYRSHIQITVETDASVLPVGLLQVDGSAQSFIQQLVITSKNRQIQRIIQYGVLASYLSDIGISELYTEGREVEGMGYSNISNYEQINCKPNPSATNFITYRTSATTTAATSLPSNFGIFPTIPPKLISIVYNGDQPIINSQMQGFSRGHLTQLNCAWLNNLDVYWAQWALYINDTLPDKAKPVWKQMRQVSSNYYGYTTNVRAEYVTKMLENDVIDTNTTYPKNTLIVKNNKAFPNKFYNGFVYEVTTPHVIPFSMEGIAQDDIPKNRPVMTPNLTSLFGYSNLYSPAFAKGVWQPFISPTVPQCQMLNGIILPQKLPIARRTFKIPLLSATMGMLIPPQQFVLLPIRAFNDLYLELTIDPYAMFTSGYNDVSEYDNIGMALLQQRAFRVTRLVYNLHTYQFYAPEMDQYLKTNMMSGIAINTNYWQMGNQYQVQNAQSITNAWPIACNEEALNQILILFYPMDYVTFPFCRKHYRISNNITKLQLRINMEYYPSQPLSGNGGNPIDFDGLGSNGIFLQQINLSNGYFFSNLSPMHKINAFNFAINQRPYDVFNTHTLYDPGMINNASYRFNAQSINYDTAMGMSLLHQNRCVGKAAYLFTFQPYAHSKNLLNGIDCRMAKQFDIILAQSPDNPFPRAQTMFIYTRSSVIVEYGNNGIININK